MLTIAPVISEQVAQISDNAPGWLDDIQRNDRVQELDDKYDVIQRVRDYVEKGDFGQQVFGGVLGVGMAVLSALTNAIIVLVLTIYFLASLPAIKGAAYRLAPASRRPRVTELGDRIIGSTGSYVAGAVFVSVCAGISTLVFTFIVGLGEYAFALAFVVGLLSLIPVVGSVISAILITLLGLTISPTVALVCLVYYLAYQQLEAYVIYPRIMTRTVDVPGSVTVVAALAGASLLGVIGALLAVPGGGGPPDADAGGLHPASGHPLSRLRRDAARASRPSRRRARRASRGRRRPGSAGRRGAGPGAAARRAAATPRARRRRPR